jgi:hypothetical protein
MISLILPKLTRSSVARDGMMTFAPWSGFSQPDRFLPETTQGENAAFNRNPANFRNPNQFEVPL